MALTALGIAGIGAGVQALTGLGQVLFAGKKKAEPKYEIPKEVFQATDLARQMAQTGMPEASRMMALQGAQQSALFASRNLANLGRGAALSGIGNVQAQLDRSNIAVAAQDASMRQQNMLNYQRALQYQAGEQKLKFQTEHASWMNKEQQRRSNVGAGMQNIMKGVDTFGSIAMMSALGGGGLTSGRKALPKTTQLGRGIAGGPSMSDYLSTSPFNTSIGSISAISNPTYNTSLNSYMPGTYGALMGTPSVFK